ncbi:MAG: VacB/RNase II family 3'-5' exoribonuclease [Polyangiaceae bacterium]
MAALKPPRRAAVIDVLGSTGRAVHVSEIANKLGIAGDGATAGALAALNRVLDDLVFDGSVTPLPGQRFRVAKGQREQARAHETVEGFLSMHPRGFGFVQREGADGDVFIPQEAIGGGMHGDRVLARVVTRGPRGLEGAIVEVVERRAPRVSGVVRRRGASAWLEPDDARIRWPIVLHGAQSGDDGLVAVAEIVRFPETADENPEGRVVELLGRPGEVEVEVRKLLLVAGVNEPHDDASLDEARAFGTSVDPAALQGRLDLTHLPLPTIDPEDARDHDDAIWAERLEQGGYRVWVAIADVSHYVAPGTALDAAACERGCSIYLPDRAIPMLPRDLSSNLCSLLPDVVRLCLVAEIEVDATGARTATRIHEAFMRSQAKLTYEGVARALKLSPVAPRDPEPMGAQLLEGLTLLREIAQLLRARRMRRGALDFDLPETKIVLDPATRLPIDAVRRAKDPGVAKAYQIVEELMLLANESVAAFLSERGVPAIYRNHGAPDPERIARFAAICERLGVEFDVDDAASPKKLAAFLKRLKSHPRRSVLDSLFVRSMKQAVYDVTNIGHFGLASPAYLHFTSPIRRYPDLVVHRAVRAVLRGTAAKISLDDDSALEEMRHAALLASERERRAMQVERDVADLYGVLLMRDSAGDLHAGTVTGVVGSGAFVTLDQPFVNVLVRTDALGPEVYEVDDEALALVAQRSGHRVTLGDTMMVEIESVSLERRVTYARRVALSSPVEEPVDGSDEAPRKRRSRKSSPPSDAPASPKKRAGKATKRTGPVSSRRTPKKASLALRQKGLKQKRGRSR